MDVVTRIEITEETANKQWHFQQHETLAWCFSKENVGTVYNQIMMLFMALSILYFIKQESVSRFRNYFRIW